jgi:hypothetical protein
VVPYNPKVSVRDSDGRRLLVSGCCLACMSQSRPCATIWIRDGGAFEPSLWNFETVRLVMVRKGSESFL